MIRRLDASAAAFGEQLDELLAFAEQRDPAIGNTVSAIIDDVRARGDDAVLEYTNRFDRREVATADGLEVSADDCRAALARIPAPLREALEQAAERIERYHVRQRPESWEYREDSGTVLGQRVTPMDRVGIYVPGGKASYPSSVLMNAIPARVAGVGEIIMVVPSPGGEIRDVVLAAAAIARVDRVFTIGGAQAVAALAFGTAMVPKVDKIVGPGNVFVAEAKRQVFGVVGIDMIAGPSEIAIVCDGSTDPRWIVCDLFSQAEHDENAQAILICDDAAFLDRVEAEIARMLPTMPRAGIIEVSLSQRGALIQVPDLEAAADVVNRIAPEHLELSVAEPRDLMAKIRHAGAIFLGRYSSESLGDYCAGPSHVLPTSGTARFSSPLGVYDFQKRTSIIDCAESAATELGRIAATLADSESLDAHAAAARVRFGEYQ